jgi:hypothetical protein
LVHARVGVTGGYVATVDSYLLAAAEKVARYIAGAMNGEVGKVVKLERQSEPPRHAHV